MKRKKRNQETVHKGEGRREGKGKERREECKERKGCEGYNVMYSNVM
jgi:hypothetical protein